MIHILCRFVGDLTMIHTWFCLLVEPCWSFVVVVAVYPSFFPYWEEMEEGVSRMIQKVGYEGLPRNLRDGYL